ncbi:MAG: HD domain-containing protein [Clostridia bacterium]|nr:HD domain-containing protein [Clostridia bacterium]MDR3644406.1 HD domain-containing protein [Clostridia bacterium]
MKEVPSLSPEKLASLQEEFIGLLRSTQREGIDDLIDWLCSKTDFFTAPASAQYHGAFIGGLVTHSLAVYKYLRNFTKTLPDLGEDTLIITGLLHDLCKVNFFTRQTRNVKIPGEKRWEEEESFGIDDRLPMGHGEKSVYLAMKYIPLTDEEALAIRWHMGGYDDAARAYVGGKEQSNAYHAYPFAAALNIADMYVTYLLNQ